MAKTHPVHIIEVDCSECKGKGLKRMKVNRLNQYKCSDCNAKGKRRRAVWQLSFKNTQPIKILKTEMGGKYHKENEGVTFYHIKWLESGVKDCVPDDIMVKIYSPYQSNTDLPTGETLGEVELKVWLSDSDWLEFHHHKELSHALKILPDYAGRCAWLCTALIKEKTL